MFLSFFFRVWGIQTVWRGIGFQISRSEGSLLEASPLFGLAGNMLPRAF